MFCHLREKRRVAAHGRSVHVLLFAGGGEGELLLSTPTGISKLFCEKKHEDQANGAESFVEPP